MPQSRTWLTENFAHRFDRIESQIRLLADSAFLMRDLDTAVAMYRMARDDFKSDRRENQRHRVVAASA